jgi:hypothetical protein
LLKYLDITPERCRLLSPSFNPLLEQELSLNSRHSNFNGFFHPPILDECRLELVADGGKRATRRGDEKWNFYEI